MDDLTAEQVIEVTIGLWPDDDPPGKRPVRLAAAIVDALRDEGYAITAEPRPRSVRSYFDTVRSMTADPEILAAVDRAEKRGG